MSGLLAPSMGQKLFSSDRNRLTLAQHAAADYTHLLLIISRG
jgi:hypothetical protein